MAITPSFLFTSLIFLVTTIPITVLTTASQVDAQSVPPNRTYSPQAQVQTTQPQQPTLNNITSILNNTAVQGMQYMRQYVTVLEPEIRENNLTGIVNNAFWSFVHIRENITALEKQVNSTIQEAQSKSTQLQTQVDQLQKDLYTAKGTIRAIQQQLTSTQTDLATAKTQLETRVTPPPVAAPQVEADEPEPTTDNNNNDETIRDLVGGIDDSSSSDEGEDDGPRTDPEGDGGALD